MSVVVTPRSFSMVDFDHAELTEQVSRLASETGLPHELDISIEVIEDTPATRVVVLSIDPLRISIEGGAIEDPKRPRCLADHRVVDVVAHAFFQAHDRLDANFGAPALDDDVPLAHRVAWDAYALGRIERLGYDAQRARRLYHFRNRHGFTDAADATFDHLWSAEGLTWPEITAASDEARR